MDSGRIGLDSGALGIAFGEYSLVGRFPVPEVGV